MIYDVANLNRAFYDSVSKNYVRNWIACDVIAKNDISFQKYGRDVTTMTSSVQNQFFKRKIFTNNLIQATLQ